MSTQAPANETPLEIVPPSALESITRGEIDTQIATAHKFPRSMEAFKKRALNMALIDEETAQSCIYVRPVGKKPGSNEQQYAEGLSIRMAEIVGASYGNIRVGSMIIEQTERYVKCRGVAHDLESNFASTSECIEATITKKGEPFSEGMRNVVAKACLAKAWRDALFKVVPRALCKPIEAATRELVAGNTMGLEKRRANVMIWLKSLGIDLERVWAALGVKGEADLTNEHLLTLVGIRTSIKDGETPIEEAFPRFIQPAQVGAPKTEEAPASPAKPASVTEAAVAERKRKKAEATPKPPEREMPNETGDPQRQAVGSDPEGKVPTAAPNTTVPEAAGGESAPPASVPTEDDTARKLVLSNILAAAKNELSCGKTVLTMHMQDLGWLNQGESFDSLDLATAQGILDRWDVLSKKVKGGGE